MKKANIVLIGFMGTGKTAVGKTVASALDMKYLDTDLMIEADAQKTIPEIFETLGEPAFREFETEAIRRITHLRGYVIATGGGAPMIEENLANMKRAGVLIRLTASPEVILERTSRASNRPLLKTPNPMKKIQSLLSLREPQYNKADYTINTTTLSIQEVAEKVIKIWESQPS
ncbi:MAG TPA: shikimate kinase [Candidatus Sumerlaeota bacterium]|nr:MAG: Shikimate kinase 1 [candidate division BRC1 bacterium ADurb.Bin183]HOE63085.1 shikimate kinase [Candidatus Sumerlaeota bacterium]HRR30141.1 shikimate kinase [Candidatus Sumerlaeia bacterium]HON51467.1 shikimate kinase [Candidatus Sumerlaeota bacterium]HOR65326.1 shikimate kinase [Candidatus Sumerlaeota bacterium]